MSLPANQLRPGTIIDYDGSLWLCLESIHKTPGNLRAFIQAKMRKIKDGTQKEFRFSSTETLERVFLRDRAMQFLYADGEVYHFMDQENYEQIELNKTLVGEAVHYLMPEAVVKVTFQEDTPLGIILPKTLEFNITECEPCMKSASATTSFKNATIDTGKTVKVPQFVEAGDRIVVNTESGEYVERAKK